MEGKKEPVKEAVIKPVKKKRMTFEKFVKQANINHLSMAEKKKRYSVYVR